jgi:hypothetical protein
MKFYKKIANITRYYCHNILQKNSKYYKILQRIFRAFSPALQRIFRAFSPATLQRIFRAFSPACIRACIFHQPATDFSRIFTRHLKFFTKF